MNRTQLVALVTCNMGLFIMGNMALTLLPVYAVQLGMDEGAIGIYLGLAFAGITAGALSSSWFSDRFQRRRLTLVGSCVVGIPAAFLMGQVNSLVLLTIFTLIVWFTAGLAMALVNILTGQHADPGKRGLIFGIMASSTALGVAVGSFAAGAIVDRWGYTALFSLTALVWLVPIVSALFIQDTVSTRPPAGQPKPAAVPLGRALWLLLIANTLLSVTSFSALLARPLTMNELRFAASAISSAVTISALVGLPLPFLVGWLSDRIGRKRLLIASYIAAAAGMVVLVTAQDLWQFWLSASLISLATGTMGVANAFVADLARPEALGTALSRFSATQWIGAIFGYSVTGIFIGPLGLSTTVLIGAALPILVILMLVSIRKRANLAPA